MDDLPAWIERLPARAESLPGWVNRLPAGRGRVAAVDTHRMLEEGLASVRAIEEAQLARWERNRAARERAMAAYERANAEYAARQAGVPPVRVAASLAWWHRPQPLDVW